MAMVICILYDHTISMIRAADTGRICVTIVRGIFFSPFVMMNNNERNTKKKHDDGFI